MKIGKAVLVLTGLFGVALVVLIIGAAENSARNLPAGYTIADATTVRQSGIKDEGEWLVTTVLTNAHGVNLVKLMSPKATNDTDFARYALATDSSVTNGTMVKLVQAWNEHSTATIGQPGFTDRAYLAIPIK
jgi:hypothetical protein